MNMSGSLPPVVYRASVRSRQGLDVYVTYSPSFVPRNGSVACVANGVSISVAGNSGLDPTSKIRAVLINRCFQENRFLPILEYYYDMFFQGQAGETEYFSANPIDEIDVVSLVLGEFPALWVPQVAVCVDGVWQTDPVQGEAHNFNFSWQLPESFPAIQNNSDA